MSVRLSVIIVNYNVKFFLEQCLHSVVKASQSLPTEIFVVDNNSVDGSMAMVDQKFPDVIRIENKENLGFSRANNQAIKRAKGDYILLLNPDTVVEEDTFFKVVDYLDTHPEAGALGVKMIDGKGQFLPESKRALPTPWVSFYKVFGLSSLFPRSKKFGKYHLGYLNKDEIHEVDVLPGAFMLLRKKALDSAGLLDETFFMYGEDIDLSYRIQLAGYKVIYYPETAIIHYKGESTKKGSLNYVLVFYQAMIIFARKHFHGKNARFFTFSIHGAIYFRMVLSLLKRFFNKALYPLLDMLIAVIGLLLINPIWESVKFTQGGAHPGDMLKLFVPAYTLIWLSSIYFTGGYDKPYSIKKSTQGLLSGTLVILAGYALLPEGLRFSRALILLGTVWNLIFMLGTRMVFDKIGWSDFRLKRSQSKKIVIVGQRKEYDRIRNLIGQIGQKLQVIGRVDPMNDQDIQGPEELGKLEKLDEIVAVNGVDEIIFSGSDLSSTEIIRNMLALRNSQTDYKISPPDSTSIIGSNSINTAGDLYVINISSIAEPANRRKKRLLDLILAFTALLTLPLNIWFFIKRPLKYLRLLFEILLGFKTWVSYFPGGHHSEDPLPKLKPGLLYPALSTTQLSHEEQKKYNLKYARNYTLRNDIAIIFKNLRGIL